jgi:uncharacterized protein YihD (DUF1040 family)
MRDIKRIEPLLETLRKIWLEHPDYRLMQLLGNVYRGDPYYVEDDDLLQRLESTYLPERDACINAEIPVALEGEISISKVKDLVRKVSDLQAQLRQVEGERDHAKKMEAVQKEVADNQTWHVRDLKAQLRWVEGQSKQQAEEAVIVFAKYTTLQQLLEDVLHTFGYLRFHRVAGMDGLLYETHNKMSPERTVEACEKRIRATLTPAAGGTRHGTN